MTPHSSSIAKNGYCIYIDTLSQGRVPAVSDEKGKYIVFDTELAAQREIVDNLMTRLQEFMDGHRDFEEATGVEEFIVPVTVYSNNSFADEDGNRFNQQIN